MPDVKTIYQETILPLPNSATIILQGLSNGERESQTAFDLLQNIQGERVFSTSEEVDKHLQAERESWEN